METVPHGPSNVGWDFTCVQCNVCTDTGLPVLSPIQEDLGKNVQVQWACLAEGLNASVLANGFNLPDKQVDQGCWLRSGSNPRGGNMF